MLIRTGFRLNSSHHFPFHFQGRNASTSRASKELGWYDTRITFASRYKLFLGKQVREVNAALPSTSKLNRPVDSNMQRLAAQRWEAMSVEERIATTEAEYQKRKAVVDQWWQKQEDVSLDEIAEEMKTYLDRLKDVRNMALDDFGQMLWLSPEHRRQILQGKTRLTARKQELERMLASLIHAKLGAVVGKERIRMHYKSFDSCVTARCGVTIENWPPMPFASPPKINNVPSLVSLYLLWKSGATRFRRLSSEEKKQWDKVREDLMREAAKNSAPVPDNSLKVPPSTPARYPYSYLQLIDTRTIGTIDQVSAFFNPPLRPTGRKCVKKGYPFI